MLHKHVEKLVTAIVKKDTTRFKSVARKYREDVELASVRLPGDGTLLHAAAESNAVDILRYLLKKKVDPFLVDRSGNLPIHVALTLGHNGIVSEIMEKYPLCVDVPNRHGLTARHMLEARAKAHTKQNEDDKSFKSRLADEMADEFAEQYGKYDEAFSDDEGETWDNWADRMHHQHDRQYHQTNYSTRSSSSRKRKTQQQSTDSTKDKPKISDKKRAKFKHFLQEESEKLKNQMGIAKSARAKKCRDDYEIQCKDFFNSKSTKKIKFNDVPWPHAKGDKDLKSVAVFLFFDMDNSSDHYKKALKAQQVRWHPDRFLQKCGQNLAERDQTAILDKVNELSQFLNGLIE